MEIRRVDLPPVHELGEAYFQVIEEYFDDDWRAGLRAECEETFHTEGAHNRRWQIPERAPGLRRALRAACLRAYQLGFSTGMTYGAQLWNVRPAPGVLEGYLGLPHAEPPGEGESTEEGRLGS